MSQIITETTGSLDSVGGFKINQSIKSYEKDAYYFVDYTKLSSVNDLMLILGAVGFNFHTTHPYFESVKHFLDLENPVKAPKEESK